MIAQRPDVLCFGLWQSRGNYLKRKSRNKRASIREHFRTRVVAGQSQRRSDNRRPVHDTDWKVIA
jgi:hypothetical protein